MLYTARSLAVSGGMSKCFKHRRSAGEDHRRIRWLLHSLPPNRFSQRRRNVASSRPLNASRKESELRLSGLRRKKLRPSANRRQRASGKRLPRQHSGSPGRTRRAPRRHRSSRRRNARRTVSRGPAARVRRRNDSRSVGAAGFQIVGRGYAPKTVRRGSFTPKRAKLNPVCP